MATIRRSRLLLALCMGAGLALALPSVAFAKRAPAARAERVDKRQNNQRARIQQGKRSGEITGREAKKIERQQRDIKRAERRAKADGKVTRREARKIERKQDRASKTIHRAKHNDRKRPRAR